MYCLRKKWLRCDDPQSCTPRVAALESAHTYGGKTAIRGFPLQKGESGVRASGGRNDVWQACHTSLYVMELENVKGYGTPAIPQSRAPPKQGRLSASEGRNDVWHACHTSLWSPETSFGAPSTAKARATGHHVMLDDAQQWHYKFISFK